MAGGGEGVKGDGALYIPHPNVLGSYAYQCYRSRMVSSAGWAVHMVESAKRSAIYKQIVRNEKAIGVR